MKKPHNSGDDDGDSARKASAFRASKIRKDSGKNGSKPIFIWLDVPSARLCHSKSQIAPLSSSQKLLSQEADLRFGPGPNRANVRIAWLIDSTRCLIWLTDAGGSDSSPVGGEYKPLMRHFHYSMRLGYLMRVWGKVWGNYYGHEFRGSF
uniref:Uncharacterized protein n=1 Tax=Ananas comosus var. bracteatus TaxID=296719 RepID=A0A6V7P2V5_ANACO|nr:unnamed protein product [Ananas comosus var. bracteatus]